MSIDAAKIKKSRVDSLSKKLMNKPMLSHSITVAVGVFYRNKKITKLKEDTAVADLYEMAIKRPRRIRPVCTMSHGSSRFSRISNANGRCSGAI